MEFASRCLCSRKRVVVSTNGANDVLGDFKSEIALELGRLVKLTEQCQLSCINASVVTGGILSVIVRSSKSRLWNERVRKMHSGEIDIRQVIEAV